MNESPTYIARLASSDAGVDQDEALWEASLAAYGEGDYLASLSNLIRYLDSDKLAEGAPLVGEPIVLEHGSVRLQLTISEEQFALRVPFVKMPTGGRAIALMRKALEISTHLNLSSFRLEGDALVIRYQDELSGCHPDKLLDVMLCICRVADRYDDLFTMKMGAELLEPAKIEPWSGARLDAAHAAFTQILNEGVALAEYWESKQNLKYAYYALDMAMDRLSWVLHPQGYVRSQIGSIFNKLRDGDRTPAQRIAQVKKLFGKLAALPKDELSHSLYEARFIIPEQREIDLEQYQGLLQGVMEAANGMRQNRKYELAVTTYMHSAYEDLRGCRLPAAVVDTYTAALERSAGLPWREAAEILGEAYKQVKAYKDDSGDGPEAADDFYRNAKSEMKQHMETPS